SCEKIYDFVQKVIFLLILLLLTTSTFCSSELLGMIALSIFGLTCFGLLLGKGEKLEMNLFEKFIFLWFLVVIVSLFGSTLFSLSVKGFLKTVTYMGFYLSAVQFYRKNVRLILPTMFVIAFCSISQGVFGILQNFRGVEQIATWQDTSSINPEQVLTRVYGTLKPYNPNLFGGYLVATIPTLIGVATYLFSKRQLLLGLAMSVGVLVTSVSLILSGCRGAYIAFAAIAVGFAVYFWILFKDNAVFKKIYLTLTAFAFTLAISAMMFVNAVRTRILSIFVFRADSSTSFRFNVYQAAVEMIKDNWLLGIGVGNKNFREIYGLYMKTGFDALSTYNVFTELWVESGIFALIAYLAFLFVFIKDSVFHVIKKKQNHLIPAVALITVVAVMVHGLVDTIYFRPQVQFVFWSTVAFCSAVLYGEKRESCE
ncbi:O-antigen ligase family protein, partial [bacterium]|nr:O-antigen ligase family protein [bacterium]